jgi:hypothetical protein
VADQPRKGRHPGEAGDRWELLLSLHLRAVPATRSREWENMFVTLLSDWVERGTAALAGGGWIEARACFEQALGCSDFGRGVGWALLGLLVA